MSSTQDVDAAVKEWVQDGSAFAQQDGTCELCGKHPIVFHFPIKNKVTGKGLLVGSECIYNYLQISGFEKPEELRRRLNGERNRLKKQLSGEISGEELATYQSAFKLEAELRAKITTLGTGGDFDWSEYQQSLREIWSLANNLGIKELTTKVTAALDAIKPISRLSEALGKRSAKVKAKPGSLIEMCAAAMRLRDDEAKLIFTQSLGNALKDLVSHGKPSETVARFWGSFKDYQQGMVDRIEKANDLQKKRLGSLESQLDNLKPYDYLHFCMQKGIDSFRDNFDQQAKELKKFVTGSTFIDVASSKSKSPEMDALSTFLTPYLTGIVPAPPDAMAAQAVELSSFLQTFGWTYYDHVNKLREIFAFEAFIRDHAGVKVSVMRALNDSIIEIGPRMRIDMKELVKNQEFKRILFEEVDELKALKGRDMWEFLADLYKVDIKKAWSAMDANNEWERNFATDLVERWPSNRHGLSPKQMAILQKKMARHDRPAANMWDALKAKLMAPAPRM